MNTTIRRASLDDLKSIALIHKQAYSSRHFTSLLRAEVLQRYYSYFIGGGSEIILVVKEREGDPLRPTKNESVLGFAVFGTGIGEKIARFKNECFQHICIAFLRHPIAGLRKVMGLLVSKFEMRREDDPTSDFLLLSIAVAVSKNGIGKQLLESMIGSAEKRGFKKIGLYVNTDNISAINAYFAAGFGIKTLRSNQYYMELSCASGGG